MIKALIILFNKALKNKIVFQKRARETIVPCALNQSIPQGILRTTYIFFIFHIRTIIFSMLILCNTLTVKLNILIPPN